MWQGTFATLQRFPIPALAWHFFYIHDQNVSFSFLGAGLFLSMFIAPFISAEWQKSTNRYIIYINDQTVASFDMEEALKEWDKENRVKSKHDNQDLIFHQETPEIVLSLMCST